MRGDPRTGVEDPEIGVGAPKFGWDLPKHGGHPRIVEEMIKGRSREEVQGGK